MKLSIHQNSLRVRLNRSDIGQFRRTGICADILRFSSGSPLIYTLETSADWTAMEARYYQDCIRVMLPLSIAQKWVDSDQASLSYKSAANAGPSLLVEKDFQGLHSDERDAADDGDSFPQLFSPRSGK